MATGKYERWLTPEGLGEIEAWARDGLTDEQLARKMGISRETLRVWAKKYPGISGSVTRGRGGAREQIENAVYKRALGYTVEVKEPMKVRRRFFNPTTGKMEEQEEVVQGVREVHIPPDTRAAQMWLTNRERDRWAEHPTPIDGQREAVTVEVDL